MVLRPLWHTVLHTQPLPYSSCRHVCVHTPLGSHACTAHCLAVYPQCSMRGCLCTAVLCCSVDPLFQHICSLAICGIKPCICVSTNEVCVSGGCLLWLQWLLSNIHCKPYIVLQVVCGYVVWVAAPLLHGPLQCTGVYILVDNGNAGHFALGSKLLWKHFHTS